MKQVLQNFVAAAAVPMLVLLLMMVPARHKRKAGILHIVQVLRLELFVVSSPPCLLEE